MGDQQPTAEVGGLSGRRRTRTRGLFKRDEAQMTHLLAVSSLVLLVDPESAFLLALVSKLPYSFKELSRGKRIIFLVEKVQRGTTENISTIKSARQRHNICAKRDRLLN